MQKKKFTGWCFAFFIVVCVMFASSQVMADSSTCRTMPDAEGDYIQVSTVTDKGFPRYFKESIEDVRDQYNNSDTGYCGSTISTNYPCTVFLYNAETKGPNNTNPSFNVNHLYATIPVCPDDQLRVLNYNPYPLCKPGSQEFADTLTCNMKSIFIPNGAGSGTASHFSWISIHTPPGKTVELGVNNMVFTKSGSPTQFFACNSEGQDPYSVSYPSGILGPGCLKDTTCKPNPYAAKTTNMCLPNVNGKVVKLDVENKEIKAVYECPPDDKSCTSPDCVKKDTYEVEIAFYDENGNPIEPTVSGAHAYTVTDAGGTVEEAIGYFVVSDSFPSVCIAGLGGRTICYY